MSPETAPADASGPSLPSPSPPWYMHRHLLLLVVITLVGAALRFATLDRPPLWGDEALTYSRVFGSWDEMLRILRNDGFTPLNYFIYWWIEHDMPVGPLRLAPGAVLTPPVMRIVPALCGTLMIPAMYFATRQLASVRASLLAAGLACVSAYLMAYAHDAKMYMQCWLFVTLNLACFLWWLRSDRWVAWAGWILAGLIAIGFHISAVLVMLPQLVILLTHRRVRPMHLVLMAAGLLLLASGPYAYYRHFNRWNQQVGGLLAGSGSGGAGWDSSGIAWVDEMNRGVPGPKLVLETASAYLVGTEWTDSPRGRKVVSARVSAAVGAAFLAVLAMICLGALPWRRPWAPAPATTDADPPAESAWRVALWLGLLLIVPAYGFFYCRSVHDFTFAAPDLYVLAAFLSVPVLVYFSGHSKRERLTKLLQFAAVACVLLGVLAAITFFWSDQYSRQWQRLREVHGQFISPLSHPELDWKSLWMPRYVGIVWPIIGIGVCILISRLPTPWLRWPAIVLLLGVNGANAMIRLSAGTEPPHPRVFADLRSARDSAGGTRVFLTSVDPDRRGVLLWLRASNFGLYGDAGRYYACMMLGLQTTPDEFRSGQVVDQYHSIAGEVVSPGEIPRLIRPGTTRVVIWERYAVAFAEPEQLPADDEVPQALGPTWKLTREPELFRLRSWFDWGDIGWMRRREFRRSG